MKPNNPSTTKNNPALGLPANGILRIYNQFPRCYTDINQMTLQLPYIAAMGFNVVWINPIQETGKEKHPLAQKHADLKEDINSYSYSGSLYATRDYEKIDDDFSTDKKGNKKNNIHDIEALRNYAKTAKHYGLTPIFDLVLNQVAIDAEIYKQHPDWFHVPSDHFGDFCCDFKYKNRTIIGKNPYNGRDKYAYSKEDSTVCDQVKKFIKGEIYKYIVGYGFLGVRVDAAKHLPWDIQKEIYDYIRQLCSNYHGVKPIIYAEIIGGIEKVSKTMQGLGITHVMNTLFLERFTQDYREVDEKNDGKGFWEKGPQGGNDVLLGLWLLRQIVHGKQTGALGGTISFSGSHDYESLYQAALLDQAKSRVEKKWSYQLTIPRYYDELDAALKNINKESLEQQEVYLKEKIAAMAFTSDAGWYLLSGDEFGHPNKKWVFDFYNPTDNGKLTFKEQWGGRFNLCSFIASVNEILAALPPPNVNYWVQHVVHPDKKELMIVIRHNTGGYDKPAQLIITNLSNKEIALGYSDIVTIAKKASFREYENELVQKAKQCVMDAILTGNIFCLGKFKFEKNLVFEKNYRQIDLPYVEPLLSVNINGIETHFEEHWVEPNGNCGFIALGVEREDLVTFLLNLLNSNDKEEYICNFLAEEIKNALMNHEVSDDMLQEKHWQQLSAKQIDLEENIDQLIRQIKQAYSSSSHNFTDKTHQEILKFLMEEYPNDKVTIELKKLMETLKNNINAIDSYCKDTKTVTSYLNEYINTNLWLGYKTAILFAKYKGISLYIFQKDAAGKLIYDPIHSHQSLSVNTQAIYMVHTSGFTHFNLLQIASPNKIQQYQQILQSKATSASGMQHANQPKQV